MIFLTGVIAIGGFVSALTFGFQLHEMKVDSDLTRESIRISRDSFQLSRQTLIASQRPWVSIEIRLTGPLNFNNNGAQVDIGVTLKNHGHSPALNVRDFVIFDPDPAGRKGPSFCELQRTRSATNFAQVIFPDDKISEIQTARAESEEIKRVTQTRQSISPLITACVNYISQFDDVRHQTKLTANLLRTPSGPKQVYAITPADGDVPLHLEILFGGFTAD